MSRHKLAFGHGTDSATAESAWIASYVCRLSVRMAKKHMGRRLTPSETRRANAILQRRIQTRIPLAYILKEAWLENFRFYIDERAIVPRSYIAALIHQRLRPWIDPGKAPRRALDLCTGSGCLAIILAKTFRKIAVDALDISTRALEVARINLEVHDLEDRVNLVQSNLFQRVPSRNRYDLIICNPPYVTTRAMRILPSEYRFEPEISLWGGEDGMSLIREIVARARHFLTARGILVLEVGSNRSNFEAAFPSLEGIWIETNFNRDPVVVLEKGALPVSVN